MQNFLVICIKAESWCCHALQSG